MFEFPKTGDDELDFIREASEEVFQVHVKQAAMGFGVLFVANAIIMGIVAVFSLTGALWVGGVLFTLLVLIGVLAAYRLYIFRKEILMGTESQDALNAINEAALYDM
ncbi:hypothetical protein HWB05_gp075 [Streptomyces phage BRock]|uniref:Uncharacterized protein n=1 Tax=Streptomyces phage BRock TaxID=1913591 RepID=A0A1J0GVX6_9CAUD|nr:hypothetical protein HWB05_gp075 [Streptomyces phage BRock]APC46337.1 hypothetical protein [Streptomyces phage BRock]